MSYEKPEITDPTVQSPTAFIVGDDDKTGKKINFISNIVDGKTLHKVQSAVLTDLANRLVNSFGPHGSNTCIKKLNALSMYTKDGHTILDSIQYNGIIEQSIKDDISLITLNIAKTVGDGTTSAVLMSKSIFDYINDAMTNNPSIYAADVIRAMDKIGKEMDERIRADARPATLQDIYDIAYTSSNGEPWVAQLLFSIYDSCGMEVFVDVAPTTAEDTSVKIYDGMTINSGFMDACFVTNNEKNLSVVDNPEVYFFDDPIDTKEMGVLLDAILSANVMMPYKEKRFKDIVPTVVVCPKISRDMSSFMDILISIQSQLPAGNKLPVTFIINRTQPDQIKDIATLCGAKSIFKYIDAEIYKEDVEKGIAPTPINIKEWAGACESVEASTTTTKFIHPALMKNEDGSYTTVYENILAFVESEIKKNSADGGDARELGTLKRRLHSLKSNLVEVRVGGMSAADRDAMFHLIEDAVKNCRSAAENGVGWGANMSGSLAIEDIFREHDEKKCCMEEIESIVYSAIRKAYADLVDNLYATKMPMSEAMEKRKESIEKRMPLNLRNNRFDGTVKSSIESDTIILNSVMKIVGMMVTCNQFAVPSAQHNVYSVPFTIE